MTHTIESVKAELPNVQIKIGKQIVTANVIGRKMPFARVWNRDNMDGWEFSWQAIVNSLNNDTPLTI